MTCMLSTSEERRCTLSRATVDPAEQYLDDRWMVYELKTITACSTTQMEELQRETGKDPELQDLMSVLTSGWPRTIKNLKLCLRLYWSVRDRLTALDGVVFMGERFVVPISLRDHILDVVHDSHFGIEKCKARAAQSIYWPAIAKAIEAKVGECTVCQRHLPANVKEPMIPHQVLEVP